MALLFFHRMFIFLFLRVFPPFYTLPTSNYDRAEGFNSLSVHPTSLPSPTCILSQSSISIYIFIAVWIWFTAGLCSVLTRLQCFHTLFWTNNCLILMCCTAFNARTFKQFSKCIIQCPELWEVFFAKHSVRIARGSTISFCIPGAFLLTPSLLTPQLVVLESKCPSFILKLPLLYRNPDFLCTVFSSFVVYFIVLLDHIVHSLRKNL